MSSQQIANADSGKKWQAILFDMYGTLLHQAPDFTSTSRHLADDLNVPYDAYEKARRQTYRAALTGAYRDSVERQKAILSELGKEPDEEAAQRLARVEIEHRIGNVRLYPEVEEALGVLKARGLSIALVSNATPEWEPVFESTSISGLFDAKVFSFKVKVVKPASGIYERALLEMGSAAARAMFVGDGADNELVGAKRMKMTTALVARASAKPLQAAVQSGADYRIGSLVELIGIIDQ
jgi:HAD superfamily hydrolase (TIGR01509 family)